LAGWTPTLGGARRALSAGSKQRFISCLEEMPYQPDNRKLRLEKTKRCHVLIVDDSKLARTMVATAFRRIRPDWELQEATSAKAALDAIAGGSVVVGLVDFNMPGTDGLQLLAVGAMSKVLCGELMFATIFKAMQAMGVNALDKKHPVERYLRESLVFPLYDAGNIGMQMRKIWALCLIRILIRGPSPTPSRWRSRNRWKALARWSLPSDPAVTTRSRGLPATKAASMARFVHKEFPKACMKERLMQS
jgi:Response regulator receiver domain/Acyl-CoA dehydrogenase, C-terminal domain